MMTDLDGKVAICTGSGRHKGLGQGILKVFAEPYETLLSGTAVIVVFWLILYWMYRRKIFLRI